MDCCCLVGGIFISVFVIPPVSVPLFYATDESDPESGAGRKDSRNAK